MSGKRPFRPVLLSVAALLLAVMLTIPCHWLPPTDTWRIVAGFYGMLLGILVLGAWVVIWERYL
jgi:Na+/melibiose symporter-like transporter